MVIKLRDVHISGAKVGIKTDGPVELDTQNVTFQNVEVPYDIAGAKSASIRGSRISNDPKLHRKSNRSSVGWRRVNGPPLPVFCSNCKSVFPSRNYIFGGQYFALWDNEEPCPECLYERAKLSEGLFDLTDETVRIISAPDFTHAMLASVRVISRNLTDGKLSPEEAIEQIGRISPSIGNIFKRAIGIGTTCAIFIALAIQYMDHRLGVEDNKLNAKSVEIARESLDLQGRANTDEILAEILSELRRKHITSRSAVENDTHHQPQHGGGKIAGDKTKAKPNSPSNRAKRRHDSETHRRAFGKSRHR